MKSRQSMRSRTSPKLKQKQTLIYVATGVALAVVAAVGVFIYLNLGNSEESKAVAPDFYSVKKGYWTTGSTWAGSVAPATTNINSNIEIFYHVTHVGDMSYASGSAKTLTVTDTLVIDGNLTMGNKSNVVVRDGGVLIITGNFTAENKIEVGNGGIIAIGGDMTFSNSNQDTYTANGGSLYVLGTVSGNATASSTSQNGSELQSDHPNLFTYFNGGVGTLPIKLIYFKANVQKGKVVTEWATAEEVNNDFFTVERSTDGKIFEIVAIVPGAGNSSSNITYANTDASPKAGISYYRLKQTDYDGKFQYSKVVSVTNQSQQDNLSNSLSVETVGPNPFEQDFYVEFDLANEGPVEIRLMNMQGTVVASEKMEGFMGSNRYDFSDKKGLKAGPYVLSLVQNNITSKPIRLIKK